MKERKAKPKYSLGEEVFYVVNDIPYHKGDSIYSYYGQGIYREFTPYDSKITGIKIAGDDSIWYEITGSWNGRDETVEKVREDLVFFSEEEAKKRANVLNLFLKKLLDGKMAFYPES